MRYLLLILLLAGGYYGWDYYQTGLVPRHEAIKAMEALPFVISGTMESFTDAFFESCSGFTTTGSSILTDVEVLPRSWCIR